MSFTEATNLCLDLKLDLGSHVIMLCNDRVEMLEVLTEYFKEGVKNNDLNILITTDDKMADQIKNEVGDNDFNKKLLTMNYRFFYFVDELFNAEQVYIQIDHLLEQNSQRTLRVAGDTSWIDADKFKDLHEYESGLNKRYNKTNILLLCIYNSSVLNIEQIIKLIQAHNIILFKESGEWKLSKTVVRTIVE